MTTYYDIRLAIEEQSDSTLNIVFTAHHFPLKLDAQKVKNFWIDQKEAEEMWRVRRTGYLPATHAKQQAFQTATV